MHEYDLSKMQELLHDFYNLTGIKICIYDSAENELCYYPEKLTPFCRALREDAAADGRCRACDRRAFAECKRTHRRAVYTCHAGLLECFSPILYNDKIIGYIVIGQIRAESAPAEELPADLRALYAQLPAIGMDKINSAIHILDACAGYEYVKTLVSGYDERIDARMAAVYRRAPCGRSVRRGAVQGVPPLPFGAVLAVPRILFRLRRRLRKGAQAADGVQAAGKDPPARRQNCRTVRHPRLQLFFKTVQSGVPPLPHAVAAVPLFAGRPAEPRRTRTGERA